ncbi:MAG: YHS domain-containing protein, partial [Betaproteobacteria bacterium]|nr:YHS domain-containing protein [Betaproteobacteria bacterium]
MAIDPVCGMTVDEKSAATTRVHAGTTYYFCSTHCGAKFEANPASYLKKQAEPAPAHKPGAKPSDHPPAPREAAMYTCPMHPEVRQQGPGSCPKCCMALEPETAAAAPTRTEYVCPMHPEIVR